MNRRFSRSAALQACIRSVLYPQLLLGCVQCCCWAAAAHLVVHHHLPEVGGGVRQRALRCYVAAGLRQVWDLQLHVAGIDVGALVAELDPAQQQQQQGTQVC